jgi:hypothetical protein
MLTCIFHPIDAMRVVEQEEAEQLLAKGVWFDCPAKAKQYRVKIEDEIKKDSRKAEKSCTKKTKE